MTTYLLVPAGWHGAWTWDAVVPLLERRGHTIHAITLTGLGPDDDPQDVASAILDTHADDVLRVLDRGGLTDVTLVGHSYGGMVITVAADRAAGRVSRLVHFDAYAPRDGESCWSATNEVFRQAFAAGAADTGYAVRHPRDGADPRTRPHPLASFMQAARLTGAVERVPQRDFVYCSRWDGTPFTELRDRLKPIRAGPCTRCPPGMTCPTSRPKRSPRSCSASQTTARPGPANEVKLPNAWPVSTQHMLVLSTVL